MLNNNIKILLVSFVHHIELQNLLNAPRTLGCSEKFFCARINRIGLQKMTNRAYCLKENVKILTLYSNGK